MVAIVFEVRDTSFKHPVFCRITGERVLAFADCDLDTKNYPMNYEFDAENKNFPVTNLRLIGLMGLMDPPREEVGNSLEIDKNYVDKI